MTDGVDTLDPTPDVSGQVEEPTQSADTVPEPASPQGDILDVEAYGNHLVPIEVDGRTEYVPLSQARSGLMMQADYTRKTQELALQREQNVQAERLVHALQSDPQRTLQALAEQLGVQFGDQPSAVEELDPIEQRLQQHDQFIAAQQQRELDQYIATEIGKLKSDFGQFNEQELFDYMVQNEIRDFSKAFGAMQWERQVAKRRADQQVQQQKAALPPIVGGHGVATGAVVTGPSESPKSMADAFAQAKQQLGL
jgi:hypothetical protein